MYTTAKPGAQARARCQAGGKCCTRTLLMRVLHTHTALPIGGTLKGIGYACDWELGSLSGGPSPGLLSGPVRTLRPGCWRLVCAVGVDTQEVTTIFNGSYFSGASPPGGSMEASAPQRERRNRRLAVRYEPLKSPIKKRIASSKAPPKCAALLPAPHR